MLPIQEDCWRNIERSTHYGFKESFSELKWRRRRKKKKKKIEAIEAAAATEATFDSQTNCSASRCPQLHCSLIVAIVHQSANNSVAVDDERQLMIKIGTLSNPYLWHISKCCVNLFISVDVPISLSN
ncbi:hypothetical protein BLOT_003731 [Blomia tropicalis]|nr:hypothetical protein BLOT_003731 [Blomia tropicalis]